MPSQKRVAKMKNVGTLLGILVFAVLSVGLTSLAVYLGAHELSFNIFMWIFAWIVTASCMLGVRVHRRIAFGRWRPRMKRRTRIGMRFFWLGAVLFIYLDNRVHRLVFPVVADLPTPRA